MRKAPKNMRFAHDQMDGVFELYSDQRRKVHSTTTEDGADRKESVLSKLKSYQTEAKTVARKDPKKQKKKRDGTIGLMGGFTRPKALEPCGFSLKTSAIYGRIYLGFLCENQKGR